MSAAAIRSECRPRHDNACRAVPRPIGKGARRELHAGGPINSLCSCGLTALLDFARSHAVGHLVIGRSTAAWWRRFLGGTVMERLVRQAADCDVHIVALEREEHA